MKNHKNFYASHFCCINYSCRRFKNWKKKHSLTHTPANSGYNSNAANSWRQFEKRIKSLNIYTYKRVERETERERADMPTKFIYSLLSMSSQIIIHPSVHPFLCGVISRCMLFFCYGNSTVDRLSQNFQKGEK